jgi:cell division protein FtsN
MIKLLDILQEIIEGTCGYTTDTKTGKKLNTPGGLEEADPKTGTGKKPKGSDRRLYTDENPNDTVSIKFKTKEDIVDTLNKDSFKAKSHTRQSQIINLIHQRVRAAYGKAKDAEVKSRLKRALDYIESRKESSKAKTQRLNKLKETSDPQSGKAAPYGSGYAPIKNKK